MTKNRARLSRLFLLDPVCVLPFGHNVAALANFRELLGTDFSETICLGGRLLSEAVAQKNNIVRHFPHLYSEVLPLDAGNDAENPIGHKRKLEEATLSLLAFIKEYDVDGNDTLLFPSIDFYSIYALSACVEELIQIGSPKIMIRLIGVMEGAASEQYSRPMDAAISLLQMLASSSLNISFAAETPRYANFLALHLGKTVVVLPNIEMRPRIPVQKGMQFTVIAPGSARFDKGFLDLEQIFQSVRRRDPEMRIRFRTQTLPDRLMSDHLDYVRRLYAMPGVEVLPATLSSEEIDQLYEEADLIILPYAADVYEFRGSAVMIEAIYSGRPVLALEGPAFVDQLRYFGAGEVCSDLDEMATKILEFSKKSPQARDCMAAQVRKRFDRNLRNGYRDWIDE